MVKKILIALAILFVVIQFFRIDKENPPVDNSLDFITRENPPEEIRVILKNACYDCHSHETVYPWYSHIAPVSWWLKDHIDHAREHLNFSTWGEQPGDRRDHSLEEMAEEVEEEAMPLESYTWAHEESRLTSDQRHALVNWINSKR